MLSPPLSLCLQASWGDASYQLTLLLPPREALLRCWQVGTTLHV